VREVREAGKGSEGNEVGQVALINLSTGRKGEQKCPRQAKEPKNGQEGLGETSAGSQRAWLVGRFWWKDGEEKSTGQQNGERACLFIPVVGGHLLQTELKSVKMDH
jgi:hypothetical protein